MDNLDQAQPQRDTPEKPGRRRQIEDLGPLNGIDVVAEICDVSAKTIRRQVARGKLKPVKLADGGSSKLLFPKREILRFLAELGAV